MARYSLNDSKGNEYVLVVTPKARKHKAVNLTLFRAERGEPRPGNRKGNLRATDRVEQLTMHVSDHTGDLQFT